MPPKMFDPEELSMKIKIIEKFKSMDGAQKRSYLWELFINNSLYIF